jgi:hypothetical protein
MTCPNLLTLSKFFYKVTLTGGFFKDFDFLSIFFNCNGDFLSVQGNDVYPGH